MKKVIVFIMLMSILSCLIVSFSEGIDLREMSYEQLCAIKEQVDTEYYSRPEAEIRVLSRGIYVIGENMPEGTYYYAVSEADIKNNLGEFQIYQNQDDYNNHDTKNRVDGHVYYGCVASYTLRAGEVLRILGAPMAYSLDKSSVENIFPPYEAPEGTRVQPGTYVVGEDLPEGYYYVFASSIKSSYFAIFSDVAWTKLRFSSPEESYRITIDKNGEGLFIYLANGKAIVIEDDDVIMRKRKKQELRFN